MGGYPRSWARATVVLRAQYCRDGHPVRQSIGSGYGTQVHRPRSTVVVMCSLNVQYGADAVGTGGAVRMDPESEDALGTLGGTTRTSENIKGTDTSWLGFGNTAE